MKSDEIARRRSGPGQRVAASTAIMPSAMDVACCGVHHIDRTRPSMRKPPNGGQAVIASMFVSRSESSGGSFAEMLDGLQSYEQQGANALTDLSAAREMDLHDVVIAAEMESLAFNLAVEIRNRLVDAYMEISRMQI